MPASTLASSDPWRAATGGDRCGLVFAFTIASFIFSDLRVLGQIGTTIALRLLFDTVIVRSFMTPSIAALLPKTDRRRDNAVVQFYRRMLTSKVRRGR